MRKTAMYCSKLQAEKEDWAGARSNAEHQAQERSDAARMFTSAADAVLSPVLEAKDIIAEWQRIEAPARSLDRAKPSVARSDPCGP